MVRPARAEDAPAAAELLNAIIRQGGTTALQRELTPDEVCHWFLASDFVICAHVAEEAGQLVGFQSVGRYEKLPSGWGEMATFAKLGATARGIGTALFAATRARATELGVTDLNAKIRADNVGGLAYYGRMGFIDFKVDRAVPLDDGTPMDRISKRLVL